MKARVVSPGRGVRWLAEGWRLFRAAPLIWLSAGFAFYLLIVVTSRIPLLGAVVFTVLYPVTWVGFMAVARVAAGDRPRDALAFFRVISGHAGAFAVLGLAYLSLNVLAIVATVPFTDGILARWFFQGTPPVRDEMASGQLLIEVGLSLAFYSPTVLAYWFSPMLVAWHQLGAVKALFFSFAACLVNWRALCAFGLATALAIVVGSLAIAAVGVMGAAGSTAYLMLGVAVSAVFFLTVVAAVFVSYRDVFGETEGN